MTEPAAAPRARFSPTPLRGWPQRLVHLLALLAGWGLFIWGWYDVLGQPWDTNALSWLIGGSVVVLPTITLAWVLHNVGIYRRKGPRNSVRTVDESYRQDWNGREVCADLQALSRASIVIIDIEGNRKVYRPAGEITAQWAVTRAPNALKDSASPDEDAAETAWRPA